MVVQIYGKGRPGAVGRTGISRGPHFARCPVTRQMFDIAVDGA